MRNYLELIYETNIHAKIFTKTKIFAKISAQIRQNLNSSKYFTKEVLMFHTLLSSFAFLNKHKEKLIFVLILIFEENFAKMKMFVLFNPN